MIWCWKGEDKLQGSSTKLQRRSKNQDSNYWRVATGEQNENPVGDGPDPSSPSSRAITWRAYSPLFLPLFRRLEIFVAGLPEEEGVLAGEVFESDLFFLGEVAVVVIDFHEDGFAGGAVGLDGGDEFAGLPGGDAGIVPTANAHDGGVFHTGFDMGDAVHLGEGLAFGLIFDGAEFGGVDGAVGGEFEAQGVGAADVADGGGEEIGAFGDGAGDEDAAGAGAGAGEFGRAGVALGDEIFSAGNEILPRIGLGGFEAAAIPGFAFFAAAADVGDGEDDTVQGEIVIANAEGGIEADAVGAVAGEDAGIRAVERHVFPIDN